MAKSKLIFLILFTIFTLIVIVLNVILISRGTYLTPIFVTISVIITWFSLFRERNKRDDYGND